MKKEKLKKEDACKIVKSYCEEHGIDYERLIALRYTSNLSSSGIISYFSFDPLNDGAGGLTVDRASQPIPALCILDDKTIEVYPAIERLRIKN